MIAFLIAGLILGVIARTLRGGFGAPQVALTCLAGVVGALVGGVATNLALGNGVGDLNAWSFAVSVLVGLLAVGLVEAGSGRGSVA